MPAHVSVSQRIGFLTPLDAAKSLFKTEQEFSTQASALLFLPGICFLNVLFRLWTNQQIFDHLDAFSLSLISPQVLPSAGNLL